MFTKNRRNYDLTILGQAIKALGIEINTLSLADNDDVVRGLGIKIIDAKIACIGVDADLCDCERGMSKKVPLIVDDEDHPLSDKVVDANYLNSLSVIDCMAAIVALRMEAQVRGVILWFDIDGTLIVRI